MSENPTADKAQADTEATDEAPQQEQQTNGVLVVRAFDEQGKPLVAVQALGDVKVTEIPVLLALARKEFDSALGL
jgi:hypothetical protein